MMLSFWQSLSFYLSSLKERSIASLSEESDVDYSFLYRPREPLARLKSLKSNKFSRECLSAILMINYILARFRSDQSKKSKPMPMIRQTSANARKIGCDRLLVIVTSLETGWLYLACSSDLIGASLLTTGYSIILFYDEQQPVWQVDPSFLQEQSPPQQLFFCSSSVAFYWGLEEILSYLFNLSSISLSFFSLSFSNLAYFLLLILSFSATISCFMRSTYLGSIGRGGGF